MSFFWAFSLLALANNSASALATVTASHVHELKEYTIGFTAGSDKAKVSSTGYAPHDVNHPPFSPRGIEFQENIEFKPETDKAKISVHPPQQTLGRPRKIMGIELNSSEKAKNRAAKPPAEMFREIGFKRRCKLKEEPSPQPNDEKSSQSNTKSNVAMLILKLVTILILVLVPVVRILYPIFNGSGMNNALEHGVTMPGIELSNGMTT